MRYFERTRWRIRIRIRILILIGLLAGRTSRSGENVWELGGGDGS